MTLGPASIVTNPGELLPELFIGGYGGENAGLYQFIDTTKPNAPDVTKAPKPPYLKDIMDGDRAHRMTFGLTFDMRRLHRAAVQLAAQRRQRPWFSEAEGDHYEETNSIGPLGGAADRRFDAPAHPRWAAERRALRPVIGISMGVVNGTCPSAPAPAPRAVIAEALLGLR